MNRAFLTAFLALTTALAGLAFAQEKVNYLAVNGVLADNAGPYYFIAQGDNHDAFAKAAAIAKAMDLDLHYDDTTKTLTFTSGSTRAAFQATGDIQRGLTKQDGGLVVNGRSVASPMAILVDGTAYVAITPLVAAFGGISPWNGDKHVITIETADHLGYALGDPRTGITDGVSRVAVDIPAGAGYKLATDGKALVIHFPGARAQDGTTTVNGPNIDEVDVVSGDKQASLVVKTTYPLDPDGKGFQVGTLDKGNTTTLYVDFAPSLEGQPIAKLVNTDPAATQALAAPKPQPQVVVIDPGHGGMDPGTSSQWSVEKTVVLDVALKLKRLLEQQNVKVIMTRDNDTFLTLAQRSAFETPQRNLFVSIHANSAPEASAHGIETWVFGKPLDPSYINLAIQENGSGTQGQVLTEKARQSANDIAAQILRETQLNFSMTLADDVQQHLVQATGAIDRGVRKNLFYVLRTARIPSILVELGFVSNPTEGKDLAEASYQDELAKGLAAGILQFLHGGGILAQR
ncbi:MAG TPA: N-acetylmuramoyl-L-alanine amidase [Trueperaceae bacterium]|nr:N-acetylmuramoyl-L-alanine amidase [Trueperaceae bacterium]